MKLSKFLGLLSIASAAAVLYVAFTSACKDMTSGREVCHTTRLYAIGAAVLLMLLGILLFKTKSFVGGKFMSLLVAAAGVLVVLIPTKLAPVCKGAGMICRARMMPLLITIGVVTALIGLCFLLKGGKKQPKNKERELQPEGAEERLPAAAEEPSDAAAAEAAPPVQETEKAEPVLEEEPKKKHFWDK